MPGFVEGKAIVYCEHAFRTTNGKTAHGLVRHTSRYQVLSVVDSSCAGADAGDLLDGRVRHIPVVSTVANGVETARAIGVVATHLVMGLAPDGGGLSASARRDVLSAIELGLHVDAGLHDFLSDDVEIREAAARKGVQLRDVRQPPPKNERHFFTGKINDVDALKLVVLGTDSAVGKRTTAWILTQALQDAGLTSEMVGTGQTALLQGVRYGLLLDVTTNDFLSGEIEHAIWLAWNENHPDVIVIEGQGSLLNPAYPGGYELLAAGRPDGVILQHAPARLEYDGFPGYPIQPLDHQIRAIEMISGKKVVAVTINHEGIAADDVPSVCRTIQSEIGLPVFDVLQDGPDGLVRVVRECLAARRAAQGRR